MRRPLVFCASLMVERMWRVKRGRGCGSSSWGDAIVGRNLWRWCVLTLLLRVSSSSLQQTKLPPGPVSEGAFDFGFLSADSSVWKDRSLNFRSFVSNNVPVAPTHWPVFFQPCHFQYQTFLFGLAKPAPPNETSSQNPLVHARSSQRVQYFSHGHSSRTGGVQK